jgi:hypothetical protein
MMAMDNLDSAFHSSPRRQYYWSALGFSFFGRLTTSWREHAEEALGFAGVGPVEDLRRVGQGHTEEIGPVR